VKEGEAKKFGPPKGHTTPSKREVKQLDKSFDKTTTTNKASSTASSNSVLRNTPYRSGSGSPHSSVLVSFRLPSSVYAVVRRGVPNVSAYLRGLVYGDLERLPSLYSMEENRLEVEIAVLEDELEKVHRWQNLLRKHGSGAEAYLKELKGGEMSDRSPFYVEKPRADVKPEEMVVIESVVEYREALAKQLLEKLNRLMELKKAQLPASSPAHTSEPFMSYVRRSRSRACDKKLAEEVKK